MVVVGLVIRVGSAGPSAVPGEAGGVSAPAVGARSEDPVVARSEDPAVARSEDPVEPPVPAAEVPNPFDAAPEPDRPSPSTSVTATPEVAEVPENGSRRYQGAGLELRPSAGEGRVIRYSVRVEKDLAINADQVAREVQRVLDDPRSWRGREEARFQLVSDPADARLQVYLVTPGTTDRLCAPWRTRGEVSCQNGNRVVLNARRWVRGARSYGSDLAGYHRYLVNHEFGHALGYRHVACPDSGREAPVMMQQTKGLDGCRANPWPAPGG